MTSSSSPSDADGLVDVARSYRFGKNAKHWWVSRLGVPRRREWVNPTNVG
jgi:hypothetical protein